MKMLRLLAATAALLVSLGTGVQAQTTLRIGIAEDPDILDPTLARTYVGRIVFSAVCDKLFDIDEKLNIVPQLALSHETSADGKEVTIKLRPNVKFHDGEPLDAEAAKFSIERHQTLPSSFRKSELASLDHVEVVDPLTIKLVLNKPYAPLIAQLTDRAGMMVSPKAAKEAGDKFGLKPVCAGPYKFVERVQQDRIVVDRFADYWNKDNVHIDRVVYLPITDIDTLIARLRQAVVGDRVVAESACTAPACGERVDLSFRVGEWLAHQRPRTLKSRGRQVECDGDAPGWYKLRADDSDVIGFRLPTLADQIAIEGSMSAAPRSAPITSSCSSANTSRASTSANRSFPKPTGCSGGWACSTR